MPPFQIAYPMSWSYTIAARFDEPASYGRREGMLFVPQPIDQPLAVLAAQRGEVTKVAFFQEGYGHFVVVRHDWYGETYETMYGHLSQVSVKQGDYVDVGTPIGVAGQSGSTDRLCLFLTLKHLGKGGTGYVENDVIDPAPLLVASLTPRDNATWVEDVTIPDNTPLLPGEAFVKKWRVRNTGNRTWTADYRLVFLTDHRMGSGDSVTVPETKPGDLATISVNLIAPQDTGIYRSSWILSNGRGETFPDLLYAQINVIAQDTTRVTAVNGAKFVADIGIQDRDQIEPGATFIKTWLIRNTGTTTWGTGYTLAHLNHSRMGGRDGIPLPALAPNETGSVSIELIAPTTPGEHRSTWMARDPNGNWFGDDLYALIWVPGSVSTGNKFPSPVEGDYRVGARFWVEMSYTPHHKGVDYLSNGARIGLPIRAGADGVVVCANLCPPCTDSAPNFQSNSVDRSTALNNEAPWNYGFGHIVVVRYDYPVLPERVQQILDNDSRQFKYVYVIYAHLSRINVSAGDWVTVGTKIGELGNTGNSTAPHLHLEVVPRSSDSERLPRPSRRNGDYQREDWIDPEVMFSL